AAASWSSPRPPLVTTSRSRSSATRGRPTWCSASRAAGSSTAVFALVVAVAGGHRHARILGEARVGFRELAEREAGSARVVDQLLMAAAVAEAGRDSLHRQLP